MNETTTYEFWTLDGNHLANVATDNPDSQIGELAMMHSVPVDEIVWEAYDPTAWEVTEC